MPDCVEGMCTSNWAVAFLDRNPWMPNPLIYMYYCKELLVYLFFMMLSVLDLKDSFLS